MKKRTMWKKREAVEVSMPPREGQFRSSCYHLHCARLEVEEEMKKKKKKMMQKEDAIAAELQKLGAQIHLLQLLLMLMILSE